MVNRKQVLIKALQDNDDRVRSGAAEALERLDLRERLEAIEGFLVKGQKIEKLRAIYALSNLRGTHVVDLLVSTLSDEIEDVRAAAYRVLGKIGDQRVLHSIVEGLKDESPIVERVVVDALTNFRDPQLIVPMMHMLKSKDAGVVERAIEFVGNTGDHRAEEAMAYFAVKGNNCMRHNALKALGVMEQVKGGEGQ